MVDKQFVVRALPNVFVMATTRMRASVVSGILRRGNPADAVLVSAGALFARSYAGFNPGIPSRYYGLLAPGAWG